MRVFVQAVLPRQLLQVVADQDLVARDLTTREVVRDIVIPATADRQRLEESVGGCSGDALEY